MLSITGLLFVSSFSINEFDPTPLRLSAALSEMNDGEMALYDEIEEASPSYFKISMIVADDLDVCRRDVETSEKQDDQVKNDLGNDNKRSGVAPHLVLCSPCVLVSTMMWYALILTILVWNPLSIFFSTQSRKQWKRTISNYFLFLLHGFGIWPGDSVQISYLPSIVSDLRLAPLMSDGGAGDVLAAFIIPR